jgi:hypothetical protein
MSIGSCTSCNPQQVYIYNYNERIMVERQDTQAIQQIKEQEKMRVNEITASTPSHRIVDMLV